MRAQARVAGEVEWRAAGFDHVAAPKRTVAVAHAPAGEVLRGHGSHADVRHRGVLPPAQFARVDASLSEQRAIAERIDEERAVLARETLERGQVEMMVVVTTQINADKSR